MNAYASYLLRLPRYGDRGKMAMHPGFERVDALLAEMGNPHRRLEAIHIAGTNGKGSTASMLSAILQSAALPRVGLYTSPHLLSLRERIRCDGTPVPAAWMDYAVVRYKAVMDAVQPSFFEAMTALAFLFFAEQRVSVAVIEAGLGGRLDATNVVHPKLSIITCIDYDHTNVLGHTLEAIAREKGGIIKRGVPLVTAADETNVRAVLGSMANQQSASMHLVQEECRWEAEPTRHGLVMHVSTPLRTYVQLSLDLAGRHQALNALVAIRAAELAYEADEDAIRRGLAKTTDLSGLRGRLETIEFAPRVILDVAHNVSGLRSALTFAATHCSGRLFVLIGVVQSKDATKMAEELWTFGAIVYTCDVPARRGRDAVELAAILRAGSVSVAGFGSVQSVFAQVQRCACPDDVVLICGSHYLAGAFLQSRVEAEQRAT